MAKILTNEEMDDLLGCKDEKKVDKMTLKERSRQGQMWASLLLIWVTVLVVLWEIYMDKKVSEASGILSTLFVALAGVLGANYATKPGSTE